MHPLPFCFGGGGGGQGGGRGGGTSHQIFKKRGLDRASIKKRGVVGKEGGMTFVRGRRLQFVRKK